MSIALIALLFFLIATSAFFSASETALMSLNRYRLRHLAYEEQHRAALRVCQLLEKPDQLLSVLLIGNTMCNIFASAVATMLAIHWGEWGVAIGTVLLTLIVLVFAELAPKTLAAIHAEKISFVVALPLILLLKIIYPVVWLASWSARQLLRLVGINVPIILPKDHLSTDELRSLVGEATDKIPHKHQSMLLGVLDLGKVTVEDIMVPRKEIIAIDLNDPIEAICLQLTTSQHTRLPVFINDIEKIQGILHLRDALSLIAEEHLTVDSIKAILTPVHFVLEATSLNQQLINFQKEHTRMGLVVDEYGGILGLVTLEDILEEIVGEFTTDFSNMSREIHPQDDGSYYVDGSIAVRKLNRIMSWHFSINGPKTLNGLIVEKLEAMPKPGTCVLLDGYPVEIIQVNDNRVKTARVSLQVTS